MIDVWLTARNVWDVAIAPDDRNIRAVVTSSLTRDEPVEVWVTEDGGRNWELTRFEIAYGANDGWISAIDISPSYDGKRDIAVGIRNGGAATSNLDIWVLQSPSFASWKLQTVLPAQADDGCDVLDLNFSLTYTGDAALGVVFADGTHTYFNVALRDFATNDIASWAHATDVEVCDPANPGTSPSRTEIITADLELPSDFSGQSASLRRAYVSTDDAGGGASVGIFRIDDTVVYELMDTTGDAAQRIATIDYYGTYASGKLLAGEVLGYPCTATVPTWFTDSPTVCPIPCWYPALKPTTGAAGDQGTCAAGDKDGQGNAQVAWTGEGLLAVAATGSSERFTAPNWWQGFLAIPIHEDESAFGYSRNNGETWNQTGLIDTTIDWFNDVAPAADCTTIYLASSNIFKPPQEFPPETPPETTFCSGFDSVWRSSINPEVESPHSPVWPIGTYWERVLCRVTAPDCTGAQTDAPLLRLAPDKTDGQIVFWAAQDPVVCQDVATFDDGIAMWSPDFGDYWADITPREPVQDFCAESSTLLYFLSKDGLVQKMPYTGTAWSSAEPNADTQLGVAHTIVAQAEGKVLCGSDETMTAVSYSVAYSLDAAETWSAILGQLPTNGSVHVAFDPDFDNNATIYAADDNAPCSTGANRGTVYRNTIPSYGRWEDLDMMAAANGAIGSGVGVPHAVGQYGIQLAFTGANGQTALYSAHTDDGTDDCACDDEDTNSAVCRTLWPLDGMPKPGIVWDCLDVFQPSTVTGIEFTLEPWSLKLCGCLTLHTDTTLWAIDARHYDPDTNQGMLWAFTDCVAKAGPALITEDGMLIGCDPVSGRNQEVNLCWEQLCLASAYDIEVAKDEDFTIRVIDWVTDGADDIADPSDTIAACWWYNAGTFLQPVDVTQPCCYIPAGAQASDRGVTGGSAIAFFGNFECGHIYYWRVMVRECATGQIVRSPWSEVNSFGIKAGLPVQTEYYGIKLLAPSNGCRGCPVSPVSFSWAPYKGISKYQLVLAKDAAITDIIAEAEVGNTAAYEYEGTLDYSASYFWCVRPLEPSTDDWSATFSFTTETAPPPPPATPVEPPSLWEKLVAPMRMAGDYIASLEFQGRPVGPAPLGFWVGLVVTCVLAIAWVVSLVYIYRRVRK